MNLYLKAAKSKVKIKLGQGAVILGIVLSCFNANAQQPALIEVVNGLSSPLAIDNAADGSGRLFIVEQTGRVLIHNGNSLNPVPFLDIRDRISVGNERGLLGIAFHPEFATNGQFFVNYTNAEFDTVVARFYVEGNPDVVNPSSEELVITVEQPFSNHNGGHLEFGPDGYLYIGLGDGGSGGDPRNNAQNPLSLLGKMLRIDVDNGLAYAIPPDNPFANTDFFLDEIWALGLRNPFRYSFDRVTSDLYIADVGQDQIEEVHLHKVNTPSGENYGWRLMEGSQCFNPSSNCNDGSLTLPIFEYNHNAGRCSITGGYVYRGVRLQHLYGNYIYGDFCTGEIFSAREMTNGDWHQELLVNTDFRITSFGEDEDGEIYVADINGGIYKLESPMTVSPGSGVYLTSQSIDIGVALRVQGESIVTLQATLNNEDVSNEFANCQVFGVLTQGGNSLRCPLIPLNILTPGQYHFVIEVELSDGKIYSDSVTWTVLGNAELAN